jgi:iron complex outermembrane receptor protein
MKSMKPGHNPNSKPRLKKIAAVTAMIGLGVVRPASSQNAVPSSEAGDGLQTVVVTAQKRAEPMQKTPVAINTVDAKTIENQRIVAFEDLTRVAPSMTVTQNAQNSSISLRGVGTQSVSISVESAVSVIVDDVPVIQQLQAFSNLSDIERIEVLRGPQGTLFGKNAVAGVINIVTKEPTETLSGAVQATLTSDKEKRVEASVSGPLGEQAGYRLNGFTSNRTGYIKNLTNGHDLNGENARGLRARLDWRPITDVKVKLIADFSKNSGLGPAASYLSVPPGAKLFNVIDLASVTAGLSPGFGNFVVRQSEDGNFSSEQNSLSAVVNWNLGHTTLTSISSYQDWKYNLTTDTDTTDADLLKVTTKGAASGGIVAGGPYDSKMWTQELRLTSNDGGDLNYIAGLYYSDADNNRGYRRGPVMLLTNWTANAFGQTSAIFGQMDYKLAKDTKLTGGLRLNRQTIGVDFNDLQPATPVRYVGETSENATTGKLSLQHDLAKEVMLFTSFSTGYKGSGYDVSSGFNQWRAMNPVKPEKSKSYELGAKSRFLSNRLQLNATVFRTDYDNFQAQAAVLDTSTGVLSLQLNNVGKLRTQGVELEFAYKPTRAWLFDAGVALTDATIVSFANANCYTGQTAAQGCVGTGAVKTQDLAGKQLPNAPRIKGNLSVTYDFGIGDSDFMGSLNLNSQYQSKVNYDLFQNPLTVQDAYGVLNGSVSLRNSIKGYKITLFANNILDKHYAGNIGDTAGFFAGSHVITGILPRNAQRYVGIRLKYDF